MRRRLAAISVAVLVLSGTAACGSDKGSDGGTDSAGIDGIKVTGEFNAEPTVEVDDPKISKTVSESLIEGDGPEVAEGDSILINLYIFNATTGKPAYSTFDNDMAQEVQVTAKGLPGGLDEALAGQPRGTRVVTAATVAEAIGPEGAEQVGLGKDDDVVFVTDIVSAHPTDALDAPDGTEQEVADDLPIVVTKGDDVTGFDFSEAPAKPGKDLEVVTLIQGDGAEIPATPSYVTFNYLGSVYGSKKVFDESFSKEPATFAVANNSLIKGWDQALVGVKAGSRVMLIVPPDLAYGKDGSAPDIPANATLVFVIDVLGVDA